jgi:hypothetical protein
MLLEHPPPRKQLLLFRTRNHPSETSMTDLVEEGSIYSRMRLKMMFAAPNAWIVNTPVRAGTSVVATSM